MADPGQLMLGVLGRRTLVVNILIYTYPTSTNQNCAQKNKRLSEHISLT